MERLEETSSHRLTLVVGGAGYGKSTLIREWAETSGRRVAWVALRDDPLAAGNLVDSVLRAFDRAGIGLRAHLDAALGSAATTDVAEASERRSETLAMIIARSLEVAAPGETVLVFDDLHELEPDGAAVALVGSLVRQAPAFLHIVVSSRSKLPFPIQRLRARGDLLEIGVEELAMRPEEIGALTEAAFGARDAALTERLVAATAGWPALVRLLVESLRSVPNRERVSAVARLIEGGETLFPYLAEEVFQAETPAIRELIQTVAPLESFDVDLCAALGIDDAAASIADLVSRGMFIAVAAERPGSLTLHGLIREYAARALPLDDARQAAIRDIAARWLADKGETESALRLAIRSRDGVLIRSLLERDGPDLVRRGRVDVLIQGAGALENDEDAPDRSVDVAGLSHDLRLVIGDAWAHRGDWRKAETWYRGADDSSGPLPVGAAWRLARLSFERSEYAAAAEILARTDDEAASPSDTAQVLALRAFVAWRAAESNAHDQAIAAVRAARASGDPGAISVAETAACFSLIATDTRAAHEHHAAAMAAADEAGDVIQQVRLRSAGDAFWGLERHIEELTRMLPIAEAAGNRRWLSRAFTSRALSLLDLGRFDAAEADLRNAAELVIEFGATEMTPLVFLAELHRIRGDLGQAADEYRRLLGAGIDDRDVLAVLNGGMARLLARAEPEAAAAQAREAVQLALPHHRHDAQLAQGWVALVQDRAEDAAAIARDVLKTIPTADESVAASIAHALELTAMSSPDMSVRRARLEEAQASWRRLGNDAEGAAVALALAVLDGSREGRARRARARRELRRAGIRDSAADAAGLLAVLPPEAAPAIEVRALGGFVVRRNGVPISIAEFRSKKPRDILKLLVAKRGSVTRDELVESLWPDEEPAATANRLSVNLSHLRAALGGPDRNRADSDVLMFDGQALRLGSDEVVIDLEDFFALAHEGLASQRRGDGGEAIERLQAAEAKYGGDLFEEDPYAEWAIAPREAARALYIQVARAIAQLLAARGDDDAASGYLMRVITRDPFDEAAHLELVQCLARARHLGEARRAYQAYVTRMAELEIEPAPYPET